ncbi:HAD family hydrolase [Terrabacter sp. C0L_2]|uniref:HAD family hydrolase n=1 Tax=Terrabacter sp. C0L_2 TaxID=3108389 RepID=UPI002ED3BCBD|nr:HAD hydrolase-like protein [Terrabacter sp. C0L_2]
MSHNAVRLVQRAHAVLLDFDGPVTILMSPPANARAADMARVPLAGLDAPPDVAATTDHLAVLRWTGANAPDRLTEVEQACIDAEIEAARVSDPTRGALDFLEACKHSDKPVVIVSNNAAGAVLTFLNRYDATSLVRGIVGREPRRPDLLKPHPSLVLAALDLVQVAAVDAVLIGDSVTDIEVAQVTGARAIGYAKSALRGRELTAAGADAVVSEMRSLWDTAAPE